MKKSTFALLFIIYGSLTFAQVELKGTMGIYFLSIPSMQDYVNQNFAPSDNQLSSFVSSVMFAGEGGLFVSENFEASAELAYQIYSYTINSDAGKYELVYNNIMPSLIGYYVLSGDGYNIKFGGGVGVRFATIDQSLPATGSTVAYSSIGYGFIGRIEGNTQLSGNVYANIGADIRYDINGEPDSGGAHLYNNIQRENINFNTFALGIRLGITYIIGGNK